MKPAVLISLVGLSLSFLSVTRPASAAAPDAATQARCDAYAKRAVEQFQQMQATQACHLPTDLRWTPDYNNHFKGCIILPAYVMQSESATRDAHLRQCGGLTPVATASPATASVAPATPTPAPSAVSAPSQPDDVSQPQDAWFLCDASVLPKPGGHYVSYLSQMFPASILKKPEITAAWKEYFAAAYKDSGEVHPGLCRVRGNRADTQAYLDLLDKNAHPGTLEHVDWKYAPDTHLAPPSPVAVKPGPPPEPPGNFAGSWIAQTLRDRPVPAQDVWAIKATRSADGSYTFEVIDPPDRSGYRPLPTHITNVHADGNRFTFTRTIDAPSGPMPYVYAGTIDGDQMTGTLSDTPTSHMAFTASRK
jgi:hypothetical protein